MTITPENVYVALLDGWQLPLGVALVRPTLKSKGLDNGNWDRVSLVFGSGMGCGQVDHDFFWFVLNPTASGKIAGFFEHGSVCRGSNQVEVPVYVQQGLRGGVWELKFE